MPNNPQAKKRARQDEERRLHNKTIRTSLRTTMRKVLYADDTEAAQAAVPAAMKRIDKAAKTHVIHANAAARYKSRMARSIQARG